MKLSQAVLMQKNQQEPLSNWNHQETTYVDGFSGIFLIPPSPLVDELLLKPHQIHHSY